jgi:hypothetical protein
LSHIDPGLIRGRTASGQRDDFYPFVGRFNAPTYVVPTALDNMPLHSEYGILPDSWQMMLGMAMTMSDSSAVVGNRILEAINCTISWNRKTIF